MNRNTSIGSHLLRSQKTSLKTFVFATTITFCYVVALGSDVTAGRSTEAPMMIVDELKIGGYGPELIVVPTAGPTVDKCIAEKTCDETITGIVRSMLSSEYEISKYEITFDDYEIYTESTGLEVLEDNGWGRESRPVIFVAWKDALAYAEWLTDQTDFKYRLPSVIEWEHAARAGRHTAYWWGPELGVNRANCSDCRSKWSRLKTAPVGSFPPNPWGIHDMHGNVGEFTQDCAMRERRFSLTRRFSLQLSKLSAESKFFRNCRWVRIKGSTWNVTHGPLVLWKLRRDNSYIAKPLVAYPERYMSAGVGFRVVRQM